MPKLIFKLAPPEKIAEFVFELRDSLREGGLDERSGKSCIYLPLPNDLKKELVSQKKLTVESKKKIVAIYKEFAEKDEKAMKDYLKENERYWNNNIKDIYFKEIEKLIGEEFDETYVCYITNAVVGSYFDKNIVVLDYHGELNLSIDSGVIAEELLHLLYWKVWCKAFNKKDYNESIYEGKKWSAWHISELIPQYLLVENNSFEKFGWNNMKRENVYFWIPQLRKILDPLWKNKRNFRNFIIRAHKKLGCLP